MLDKIKLRLAQQQLKREASHIERRRTDPNIHVQATVGILYDATDKDTFEMVRELHRELRQNGLSPVSLGYIDFKEATFHPLARPEADYFFKHQLNWMQKPSSPVVDNFIQEPFDILIHLSLQDFYPLDYIAALSKAGLKIGRAGGAISFSYDMSFYIEPEAGLKHFAYTIIHYLSQINHEKTSTAQRNRSSHYYAI
jgi:hypothetical protein